MPWILFALACFNLPIKLPLLFSVTKTCRKYKIFCLTPINQFLTCLLFEENKQQTSCFISSYCYNSNIQVSSSFVTYKLFFFFFFFAFDDHPVFPFLVCFFSLGVLEDIFCDKFYFVAIIYFFKVIILLLINYQIQL